MINHILALQNHLKYDLSTGTSVWKPLDQCCTTEQHTYCRVPARRGLQRTALVPGRDETQAINPLVRQSVD